MRKLFICTPLGTFAAFCYIFLVFLGGYNSKTTKDIKLKFSAFLSSVEVTKCVNFQIPRLMGFKVGIFRISPIYLNTCKNGKYPSMRRTSNVPIEIV